MKKQVPAAVEGGENKEGDIEKDLPSIFQLSLIRPTTTAATAETTAALLTFVDQTEKAKQF